MLGSVDGVFAEFVCPRRVEQERLKLLAARESVASANMGKLCYSSIAVRANILPGTACLRPNLY